MPRRRLLVVLILLVAISLVGGAAWLASASGPETRDDVNVGAATKSAPSPRRRHAAETSATAERAPGPAKDPPPAAADANYADWYGKLAKSLAAKPPSDRAATDALVSAAGKGRPPGSGLLEVLKRATAELASATTDGARDRARTVVEWTVDEALRPYREDRELFAKTYREVRFGDGHLETPGGSLVREYRFTEAAARIDALRPLLKTECYDALAIRIVRRLRLVAAEWDWLRTWASTSSGGTASGSRPVPEPGSMEARTTHPSAVFDASVRPRLGEIPALEVFYVGLAFLELGEPEVAQTCFDASRNALGDDRIWPGLLRVFDDVPEEVHALRDLRMIAESRVPAGPAGPPDLSAWFARNRRSEVAHAIGGGGPVELGTWNEDMTKSWFANGLAWAPEQWDAERAWRAVATEETREDIRGWVVRSPQWEVFSDTSADLCGHAALVLEAAWVLARDALGVQAMTRDPVGARIFKRRSDYEAITHDKSRGEWDSRRNSVLTFLDDPLATDFDEFPYPTLAHEATHAVIRFGVGGAPEWIGEGLACYVERWNPTASVAVNRSLTKDWVRRPRTLEASRDAKLLPTFDELTRLVTVRPDWVPDDFGPVTLAHYAAAESLFVFLADDAERWKLVGTWLAECRRRRDPAATLTDAQRKEVSDGWRDLVEFVCSRVETR